MREKLEKMEEEKQKEKAKIQSYRQEQIERERRLAE